MHYLAHYGEIALKGDNRKLFERALLDSIRNIVGPAGLQSCSLIFSRVLMEFSDESNPQQIESALKKVSGLEHFSPVIIVEKDIEVITRTVLAALQGLDFETFRVSARRATKDFALNSKKINEVVGAAVVTELGKKVDLEQYDINCFIEIVNKYVFVYFEKIKGRGGLPIGGSSPLLCLLSGGIDSPVAAHMMQNRGSHITFVTFDSYPATSIENQENIQELVKVLSAFQGDSILYMVPFLAVQKAVVEHVPDAYRVIFYRRMMMRIAERLALREGICGLVTGESLGQVASQTVENMRAISEATSLPILRPLVGMNKDAIIHRAQDIGTYPISIRPHDDCCSLYIPDSPVTKANLNSIEYVEQGWEYVPLIETAIHEAKQFTITM